MNNSPFKGQVIWITGASAGIGAQLAREFYQLGAKLILSARKQHKLEAVRDELSDSEERVRILPFDLLHLDQLPAVAEKALSCYGRIDMLINNAGLAMRDYALATTLEVEQRVMTINYFAAIQLTKLVLPQMLERKSGQLVVISSPSGKIGVPRTCSYTASKHALHGFFETLRSEIAGQGVYITIIVAGIIATDITANALKGDGSPFKRHEKTYSEGLPVTVAAKRMVRVIRKKREEPFVGGPERVALWINRLSPWLLRRFIRNHPIRRGRQLFHLLSMKGKLEARRRS
jgi:short-subunit dehydrogenase